MRMNGDQEGRAGKLVVVSLGLGSARLFWRVMRGIRLNLEGKGCKSHTESSEKLDIFYETEMDCQLYKKKIDPIIIDTYNYCKYKKI